MLVYRKWFGKDNKKKINWKNDRVCGSQKASGDFSAMTLKLDFSFLCLSLTKLPILPHKLAYLLLDQKRLSDHNWDYIWLWTLCGLWELNSSAKAASGHNHWVIFQGPLWVSWGNCYDPAMLSPFHSWNYGWAVPLFLVAQINMFICSWHIGISRSFLVPSSTFSKYMSVLAFLEWYRPIYSLKENLKHHWTRKIAMKFYYVFKDHNFKIASKWAILSSLWRCKYLHTFASSILHFKK